MTDEEKQFIKKVNLDKAKNKTNIAIGLMVISLLTYVIPLLCGEFDFGVIFESISIIFVIIARIYMSKYDEMRAKRYNICSMLAIGWLLVYDMIILFSSIEDIVDLTFLGYKYFWGEIFSIVYVVLLFAINKDLLIADNPTKYKESTDWFYEKYEEKEKK